MDHFPSPKNHGGSNLDVYLLPKVEYMVETGQPTETRNIILKIPV